MPAAQVSEKARTNVWTNKGQTQLGAEDQVHDDIAASLRHVSFALSGLVPGLRRYPGLAPWAAICRRFAADRFWQRSLREQCDGYHNEQEIYFGVPKNGETNRPKKPQPRRGGIKTAQGVSPG